MGGYLSIRAQVSGPKELEARCYPNGRLGGIALDGPSPGMLGTPVELTLVVERPGREFMVLGKLAWARHQSARQPPSFGVDFVPEDDARRVRVLAFARGELESQATRVEPRQQVELQVKLVHQGQVRREFLADLSPGGAFVRTWNPLPLGAEVELLVRPPLALSTLQLEATVAWARLTGAHTGMGLEFKRDEAARERLRKLLTRLARR